MSYAARQPPTNGQQNQQQHPHLHATLCRDDPPRIIYNLVEHLGVDERER